MLQSQTSPFYAISAKLTKEINIICSLQMAGDLKSAIARLFYAIELLHQAQMTIHTADNYMAREALKWSCKKVNDLKDDFINYFDFN